MDQKERFINNLDKHIEETKAKIDYSINRFDILVISLSSGGLVFTMGFIKDIISDKPCVKYLLVNLAWVFFGSSIITNLFSQVSAYYANKMEVKVSKNIIRRKRGKEIKGDQDKMESQRKVLNTFTLIFNASSLLLLLAGIVLALIFIGKNL